MYKFHISLYKNHSDSNVINKVLTNEKTVAGISRTAINILQPVINISGIDLNEFNYCYIQELKRFYFITGFILNADNTANLTLRVDVLKSYKADIKASSGLITKQTVYNPYYGNYSVEVQMQEKRYNFDNQFTNESEFILVALRG